jgi:endonuclease-3
MKRAGTKRQAYATEIIKRLRKSYPGAATALHHSNPLQLLVATILSAQCTDERVNKVTPGLFKKYRTAKDFANADPRELENEIRSTGFFRAKTRSIIGCSKGLVEKFGGTVPKTMEELTSLPGVGRKTANVILGSAFGITAGVVVDTHVSRLAQRLGFSKNKNPGKIEQDLTDVVLKKDWIAIGNLLIWHGRRVCRARAPKCLECVLSELCPSFRTFVKIAR